MDDPDPMTCDPGSRVHGPDPGTVIPDPIYLQVTTLTIRFLFERNPRKALFDGNRSQNLRHVFCYLIFKKKLISFYDMKLAD